MFGFKIVRESQEVCITGDEYAALLKYRDICMRLSDKYWLSEWIFLDPFFDYVYGKHSNRTMDSVRREMRKIFDSELRKDGWLRYDQFTFPEDET